ncbi:unnamed protein product [Acanthoscelides obtectus]|uniref:Uncharacterized protein n=1 Tax=Acanthoscelides obtectus TaxID=200917 RepID=A0A9P0L893_ACAOB|nr:unnamed protein product [Acanthoscelides obtectus]CAH1986170.1 unnamed protein product [Acanthoscelides obtectus]CAK1619836.1 hypothetical protein AOBTE_LOCUS19 [Acanthoscelides obtectus]CAK1664253.1 hypothetical protein AOBTE_LOCUS24154 [Acanthoscelides obtectus]
MAVRPDDPKFEETLLRWNEELDNEPDSDNDGTDYDDHVSIQSDRESTYSTDDSEVESDRTTTSWQSNKRKKWTYLEH